MRYKLLIIDDEMNVIKALKRIFDNEKFELYTAQASIDALEILSAQQIDLIICDYQMPGLKGTDILKYAKEVQPETIRILLTGSADFRVAITAINEGSIYYFFEKPWNNEEILSVINTALLKKSEQNEKNNLLKIMNENKDNLMEFSNKLNKINSWMETINADKVSSKKLIAIDEDTIKPIRISEILYIGSINDAVTIITNKGIFTSQESLNTIEGKLEQTSFFRCHRSYIVNMEKIDQVTPWFNGAYNIKLKGLTENIPVSRSNVKMLKSILNI